MPTGDPKEPSQAIRETPYFEEGVTALEATSM